MEINVLFHGTLPTRAALGRAMKELGFPFEVAGGSGSLEGQRGFMPMRLRREPTGIEFDVFDGRAAVVDIAGDDVAAQFDRSANFRWGGDETEMLAGLCAAAALARIVDGVVVDVDANVLSPDEAAAVADQHLRAVAQQPKTRHPGTRPADIRRYLAPLLKERSDLVLIGRLLVIRPVRHVLRGVLLGTSGDKYRFRVSCCIKPLYDDPGSVGYGHDIRADWRVWQPHFQPLLIDSLEEVFASVGTMTTLDDVASRLERTKGFAVERAAALVLNGERERAAEYLDKVSKHSAGPKLEFLKSDIDAVCAEYHTREARTVKALKLGSIWDPAPFPAELPAGERPGGSAEPCFVAVPWIARPAGLLGDVPERSGEVRFAKGTDWRDGRMVLLVPLSREEAEQRHRDLETYVLVARLPGDLLLEMWLDTGWDRRNPDVPVYPLSPPRRDIRLWLYGPSHDVSVKLDTDWEQTGFLRLWLVEVHDPATHRDVWLCYPSSDGEREVYDWRTGEQIRRRIPLTDADRELASCPIPAFGEYEEVVQRVRNLLRVAGYGEIA